VKALDGPSRRAWQADFNRCCRFWQNEGVRVERTRWNYRAADLAGDVSAGLSVAAVAVPVGLAYAAIVGLPPQAGLYSAILPAAAYAVFGPSRILVGPDAATCILVGATLTQLGLATIEERTQVAAVLALVVGVFCFAGSALRLGVVANFLSKPILTGYLVGVAATLFVGQYQSLTGVPIGSHGIVVPTIELLRNLQQIHGPTLATGVALFLIMRLLKRLAPRCPPRAFPSWARSPGVCRCRRPRCRRSTGRR